MRKSVIQKQLEKELCARACMEIDSVRVKRYFCIRLRAEDTRREEDLKTQPQSICIKWLCGRVTCSSVGVSQVSFFKDIFYNTGLGSSVLKVS